MRAAKLAMLIVLAFTVRAEANEVSGTAVIVDGDTIKIGKTTLRLFGVDAAETGQRCVNGDRKIVFTSLY